MLCAETGQGCCQLQQSNAGLPTKQQSCPAVLASQLSHVTLRQAQRQVGCPQQGRRMHTLAWRTTCVPMATLNAAVVVPFTRHNLHKCCHMPSCPAPRPTSSQQGMLSVLLRGRRGCQLLPCRANLDSCPRYGLRWQRHMGSLGHVGVFVLLPVQNRATLSPHPAHPVPPQPAA